MAKERTDVESRKEAVGWLTLAGCVVMFPALFFLCVFFPIWMGWTPRW